jgi:hypothetical protein
VYRTTAHFFDKYAFPKHPEQRYTLYCICSAGVAYVESITNVTSPRFVILNFELIGRGQQEFPRPTIKNPHTADNGAAQQWKFSGSLLLR